MDKLTLNDLPAGSLSGKDLIGLWYEQLLPWVQPTESPEQAFRVIGGDFVSLEDGTGIVHIAPTFGADDARVARLSGVPPMRVTDANGDLGRALGGSIRGVTGGAARFELCPGVLETRHYSALGIPALAYGPGLLSVAHGPNEFVSIPKLVQCAEVYALAAVQLLS